MKYDISVPVITYNPKLDQLLHTLNSILRQEDISLEIIIADDGSKETYEKEIRGFFKKVGFNNYKLLFNKKNQGTVYNLLGAVEAAEGKYVKPISPGDYLYAENSLALMYAFMEENSALAAFGRAVFYCDRGALQVENKKSPVFDSIYRSDVKKYNYKRAMKYQLIYGDFILGASIIYEKATFQDCLHFLAGSVTYMEDVSMQLLAVQKERLFAIPQNVVWYEYGSGISTNQNMGFSDRLYEDWVAFYRLLKQEFPKAPYVKRAYFIWYLSLRKDVWSKLIRRLISLDFKIFGIKKNREQRHYICEDYDALEYKESKGEVLCK